MDPSLKMLPFLLSVSSTLFSATKANNQNSSSMFQAIAPFPSTEHVIEIKSGNCTTSITQTSIPQDVERYLTSLWLTCFVPSVHAFVVVLSLPLNFMAILIFVLKIQPKKPAVVYMLNLASSDLLFVSMLPFKIAYRFSGSNWVFGPGMCRFVTATFYANMYCSVLLMMAISIDRFLAVVYPMQSLSWRTVKRACMVCMTIWIVATAAVIPQVMIEQTKQISQLNITTCHDVLDLSVIQNKLYYYSCTLSVVFFLIPFLLSITCYVGVIRKLSSPNAAAKPGKRRRAILLSAAVLCSFILSFGPTNVIVLMQKFSDGQQFYSLYFAYMLAICIGAINCCIDPLIYFYSSLQCQRHVYNLLGCKKHSGIEKDSQATSSNMATFSSGLNSSSQA